VDFASASSLLNVLAPGSSHENVILARETPLLGYHTKWSLFSLLFSTVPKVGGLEWRITSTGRELVGGTILYDTWIAALKLLLHKYLWSALFRAIGISYTLIRELGCCSSTSTLNESPITIETLQFAISTRPLISGLRRWVCPTFGTCWISSAGIRNSVNLSN